MSHSLSSDPALQDRFFRQILSLWPAIKGSLSQVRKPCSRPNCPACASGQKHPAFILSFSHRGRRICMYVPAHLVSQVQQALRNGQMLDDLLYQLGPELLRRYRQDRDARDTRKKPPN